MRYQTLGWWAVIAVLNVYHFMRSRCEEVTPFPWFGVSHKSDKTWFPWQNFGMPMCIVSVLLGKFIAFHPFRRRNKSLSDCTARVVLYRWYRFLVCTGEQLSPILKMELKTPCEMESLKKRHSLKNSWLDATCSNLCRVRSQHSYYGLHCIVLPQHSPETTGPARHGPKWNTRELLSLYRHIFCVLRSQR